MIRAAMIDENTGIVENVIMATPEDLVSRPNKIISIPKISSKDGVLSFDLSIGMNVHKWNGSKFVDLENNEVLFNEELISKIEEQDKLLETEQVPPEVI